MNPKDYWNDRHQDYLKTDWIDKPSIFSQFCINYFPASGKLLELGSGQGQDSRFFAQKGYSVITSDFSEFALAQAKKTASTDLPLAFQLIDMGEPLPFPDKHFDIIYAHLSVHYFDDKKTTELFKEIHRVLKPHGIFAALTNTIEDPDVKTSIKIEHGLYTSPNSIVRRFFDIPYFAAKVASLFSTIVLDAQGTTHKDAHSTLIRFIGKKL